MTFTEIQTEIADRVGVTSTDGLKRIGRLINQKYKAITNSLGIKHVSRRSTVSATMTAGVSTLQFTSAEKVVNVYNRNTSAYTHLEEITLDELRAQMPYTASDTPSQYAIVQMAGTTVTIEVNCIPQTNLVLYADVDSTTATLSDSNVPVFSESYHDILISAVLVDEYMRIEKPALSQVEYKRVYGDGVNDFGRLGQLRLSIATSTTKKQYQGKLADGSPFSGTASGSGGSSAINGALSWTQTGLITFDRTGNIIGQRAPFAVASGSEKVANLDADKLDGLDSTAFALAAAGVPTSPNDATKFLNGASTPAFAQVKDSDLATSDITTNNVSTSKHGFITKAPNDTEQFFRGDASWAVGFAQVCQGRLTLTSGTPVTTSDVTGATSVYFTPYGGNRVALYTSSQWKLYAFTEITLALGTLTTDLPYDVFLFDNTGTLTLEAVAWASKTARATALTTQDGVLVKSGSTNKRYLGTFHTTATTTTEDSVAKRLLWNYYNRILRPLRVVDTTNTWTYTLDTWRQANASAANQLAIVVGVAEAVIHVEVAAHVGNTGAGNAVYVGIGEDSTSATAAENMPSQLDVLVANQHTPLRTALDKVPAIGYHFYAWLERAQAAGTTTWYGDNGTTVLQSGISGMFLS